MKIIENKNNMIIMRDNVENLVFFSYQSHIATYDKYNSKLYITNLWDYSQTTIKQFKNFINNYTTFNYETKQQFQKEIENNNNIIITE